MTNDDTKNLVFNEVREIVRENMGKKTRFVLVTVSTDEEKLEIANMATIPQDLLGHLLMRVGLEIGAGSVTESHENVTVN